MAFSFEEWKEKLGDALQGWNKLFQKAGSTSVYAAVSVATLWPIAEVAKGGDWGAIGVLGNVLAGLGSNLLANQIQGWKDKEDGIKKVEAEIERNPELQKELNLVLEKLNAIDIARLELSESDRKWFVETLNEELNKYGYGMHLGERAVGGGRDIIDSIIVTGDHVEIKIIKVDDRVEGEEKKAASLRDAYLNRLYVKLDHLNLAGIDPKATIERGARLSLQSIYVSLLTKSVDYFTDEGGNYFVDENRRRLVAENRGVSAVNMLNQNKKLVLLGDPGSGKSTFINFVGLCLVGEMLENEKVNISLLRTPPPLDLLSGEPLKNPETQIWDHDALLPVHVILRDFAAHYLPTEFQEASAGNLWDYICGDLERGALGEYADLLKQELLDEGGILLLDGLDEVPEAKNRRSQICEAIQDFTSTFPKCRVLVTSRTYAYQNQNWRLSDFEEVELASFNQEQIGQFLDRWYAHSTDVRGLSKEEAQGRALMLKTVIASSDRLKELAERPLLLTLMASLHSWRGGNLPENREKLYDDVVDLLMDSWEQPKLRRTAEGKFVTEKPSITEYLKVDKSRLRNLLNRLAFEAHSKHTDINDTADITEADLVTGLLRLSKDPGFGINSLQLIEYLSNRAGVLLPRGVGIYSFPHRTFQEYLAACYLTDNDFPNRVAELARKDPERWREVALLAGAKAARGSANNVWTMADKLCYLEPSDKGYDVADEWGALLAGQLLAETADLENVAPSDIGKINKVKKNLVGLLGSTHLPATERVFAGNVLATLGDPRFNSDAWYLPEEGNFGFIEVPAGHFIMGSDDKDETADEDEMPKHSITLPPFFIAKWPVTVAQYRSFIVNTGYDASNAKTLSGIDNHPVVWVDWLDALAYCDWLTGQLKGWQERETFLSRLIQQDDWVVTLPSEAQWEKAARGTKGLIYPWGNEIDNDKCNERETDIGTTSSVGCFRSGASPYGVEDLIGNVWEWTRSKYVENGYPFPEGGKELIEREDIDDQSVPRVLRGGSFDFEHQLVRCAYRFSKYPVDWYKNIGFRVVVCPSKTP